MPDQNRIYWLHSKGYCTRCKAKDAYTMVGHWLCAECSAKKQKKRKETDIANDRNGKARELRRKRREAGVCTICGGELSSDDGVRCSKCSKKWRGYSLRYNDRHQGESDINLPRGGNGICYQCNKLPAIPGKKLCEACYERSAAHARSLSGKGAGTWRKEVNAFWISKGASANSEKSSPRNG